VRQEIQVGDGFALPLDWLQLRTVVYGNSGAGKTMLCRRLAEEVHRVGQRFCAIDLKGDWWGLVSSADGRTAGLPVVIFGGDHGHVPLEPEEGAYIGETVATSAQSVVLDLERLSKGKQVRFLAAFFEALYHHNREPLVVFCDESQRYAPQKPISPEAHVCLGAVEDFVKLGRKHGLAPVLITQRGSGTNKEVTELCDMMVAFRAPGVLDRKRVREWCDANATEAQAKTILDEIASLPTGTAFFVSAHPALSMFEKIAVRMAATYDSGETPKIGKRRREPSALAEPDLAKIRERMAAAIERAKADDPKALRSRIAELERRLKAGDVRPPPTAITQTVEVVHPQVVERMRDLQALGEEFVAANRAVEILRGQVMNIADRVLAIARRPPKTSHGAIGVGGPRRDSEAPLPTPYVQRPPRSIRRTTDGGTLSNGALPKGAREMLRQLVAMGKALTPVEISALAGIAPKSSTFRTYRSLLRTQGLVEESSDGTIAITDEGFAKVGPVPGPRTAEELYTHWASKLPQGARAMLRVLMDAYPKAMAKQDLGNRTEIDPATSTFRTYMSLLRSRGLAQADRNMVSASPGLFGGGR
jgi:uncharacterized protein